MNSSLCTFIGIKHISPTSMYNHTNVFDADNNYKNPPPNVISPIFFVIFISLWGSTHDSAYCWSAHISPAARDSFKRELDRDAWLGGVGRLARINIQTEIVNGERIFFIFNRFPRGHYLVLWVRVSLGVKVRVSVEVRARVRVSNLLGSG